MNDDYSEDALVEQPAIELFGKLGYKTKNCFHEWDNGPSPLGRQTKNEVVLIPRLRDALHQLNTKSPEEAIQQAIEELTKDRSALHPVIANREVYKLIKEGVRVALNQGSEQETEVVRVVDWNHPENNDFFLASQFWISGEVYKRRMDLIGFVNGIPLILFELKASHKRLENAYKDNLRDYKNTVPQLFWYNGFVVLSNGSESKIGSMSAQWEHFNEWKKISDEHEKGVVSLETMILGTCEKGRLLDLIENFVLFSDAAGAPIKLVAKNHQFLGVNNVIKALRSIKDRQGRLGVFWHTQGAGKSFSMQFFSQKVLRKVPGNWTFVVVTDRQELDNQIYKNFAGTGAVIEPEENVRANSSTHLKQLLAEDHRYVFTLIQKFRTDRGKIHPKISDRSDVIVMADEAHRSQYDTFAQNMRDALPKAAFIGFTGTPLMAGEEKTRAVFGDYVSIYNFRQSVQDGATVTLYYENRIPELQLTNDNLNEGMQRVIEDAELDEEQERKLEREFSREYHIITREDRLEKIAEDIVGHFMGRGNRGKAMVVSIDKATAVRMYDKVQKHWKKYLGNLKKQLEKVKGEERNEILDKIKFMEETDTAVVVSQSQNEVEDMKKKGLDILPHRKRMMTEDLDTKFKDSKDRFRIGFVCAMWMTGFDVPSCSTIYLDKPMRNHTLMQTIARANRVYPDKMAGLIVDYIGVFRNLQKALAIYGTASGGGLKEGEMPVQDKSKLVDALRASIYRAVNFLSERYVDVKKIQAATGFQRVKLLDDAVEAVIVNDDSKRKYLGMASEVVALFKAILPDERAHEFTADRAVIVIIAEKIRALTPEADIEEAMEAVETLLDSSVAAEGYIIHQPLAGDKDRILDLSKIDFEGLKAKFDKSRKRIEAEKLRTSIEKKLQQLVRMNHSRVDYLEKFKEMIDEYNSGAANVETYFDRLVEFAKDLTEEEKRTISENLSEEELAVFDILSKPDIGLSTKERNQVKKAARDLLNALKAEKLVLDWRKRQQSRAQVKVAIEEILDKELPPKFTPEIYKKKCDVVYQHIYDSYFGKNQSIYRSVEA